MQQDPLLDVEHLTVRFRSDSGESIAVDDISFQIGKNEILGIVGESGSGKSVTALSILGLIPDPPGTVTAEAIWIEDSSGQMIRLDTTPERELQMIRGRLISMIFQEPMTSLNPVFTCGDQVSETLRRHQGISRKAAREQVLELFGEVTLPEPLRIFRSYPHELSGGQKQRVMIAMAISCNPILLIADEPTTALDVSVQKTILDLLKNLKQKRNMSILFITHDLGLISRFADRVVVMYKGKIVEQGEVYRVFDQPQHPYTQGLIACRPPLDVRLRRLPMVDDYVSSWQLVAGKVRHEALGTSPNDQPCCHCEEPKLRGNRSRSDVATTSSIQEEIVTREERATDHERLYSGEPVLKVEHVGKKFPKGLGWLSREQESTRAVDDVSFFLYPGETLGIVGESG
ncbi:MAG: ATP-binding cassette domain-containing protein, partial [Bacteroidia bacterium]|nr:ATP-binding cassette domain-containing protein [Bacteroidia bacterium]